MEGEGGELAADDRRDFDVDVDLWDLVEFRDETEAADDESRGPTGNDDPWTADAIDIIYNIWVGERMRPRYYPSVLSSLPKANYVTYVLACSLL